MAEWDKFVMNNNGKATITTELDILELPSGTYFLNMEFIKKLKKYSLDDLRNGSEYPIYKMVGHTKDSQSGITARVTSLEAITTIVQEIKKNLINP